MANRRPRPQELTPAELEIMQIIWERGGTFVNDILAVVPEPKPAYTTVSTIVRILEKKGYLAHKSFGKSHEYYPLIDRESYTHDFMTNVLNNFFGGSPARMVSFFAEKESISVDEADEILKILQK